MSVERQPDVPAPRASDGGDPCDRCGSADVWWRLCKRVCRSCGTILQSCADL